MERKGVSYDVGSVMGINWRPDYNPGTVHRELGIIKNDLHCNAVRITGQDIGRLKIAAGDALEQGLEVWFTPLLWNKTPEETLDYIVNAATAAETLRERWPDKLVFVVGGEFTLFMKGILEGKTLMKRLENMMSGDFIKSGRHNQPLNEFLGKANVAVRKVFHGKVTYASLVWEQVDWSIFDFAGVDHYWSERIQDQYVDMLKPHFASGKPVIITEFGFNTSRSPSMGATELGHVNFVSLFLHSLPVVGRFVRPRLNKIYERDEGLQAKKLVDQLGLLDRTGVNGAFVSTFIFPINPYDDNPRYDLDRDGPSLVKTYSGGKHGTAYPDMHWEPKESFRAVADYYAK